MIFSQHFVVLEETGINQLTIFQGADSEDAEGNSLDSITGLEVGDEVGIFDESAILNSGDCSSETGSALVGAGVWTGEEQLEIVSIGSVDNCAFGGFQLPGWVDGNEVMI